MVSVSTREWILSQLITLVRSSWDQNQFQVLISSMKPFRTSSRERWWKKSNASFAKISHSNLWNVKVATSSSVTTAKSVSRMVLLTQRSSRRPQPKSLWIETAISLAIPEFQKITNPEAVASSRECQQLMKCMLPPSTISAAPTVKLEETSCKKSIKF